MHLFNILGLNLGFGGFEVSKFWVHRFEMHKRDMHREAMHFEGKISTKITNKIYNSTC